MRRAKRRKKKLICKRKTSLSPSQEVSHIQNNFSSDMKWLDNIKASILRPDLNPEKFLPGGQLLDQINWVDYNDVFQEIDIASVSTRINAHIVHIYDPQQFNGQLCELVVDPYYDKIESSLEFKERIKGLIELYRTTKASKYILEIVTYVQERKAIISKNHKKAFHVIHLWLIKLKGITKISRSYLYRAIIRCQHKNFGGNISDEDSASLFNYLLRNFKRISFIIKLFQHAKITQRLYYILFRQSDLQFS